MIWIVLRLAVGVYLVAGIAAYLKRAKKLEEDADQAAQQGSGRRWLLLTGGILQTILLWPRVLWSERKQR